MTHVLIAGLSARAIADSAARAGFSVTAIDAFADLDTHPSVRAVSLPRDFGLKYSAHAAACAASEFAGGAAVYASNFENDPDAVRTLATGRTLWGNRPSVLRRVRDPRHLAEAFRARGVYVPAVADPAVQQPHDSLEWMVKPVSSGGGHGVRRWLGGSVPPDCYLQEYVEGTPGSVLFVAAGGRSVSLGITRQLVGDSAFGATGYRYCGNLLTTSTGTGEDDAAIVGQTGLMASAVAQEFDLVGVNGVDFIEHDGGVCPIEVNPRWCASMELVERSYGVSVFAAHADACTTGTLPVFDISNARRTPLVAGKAIVFAREDVAMGDTRPWLDDPDIGDVPRPGERIAEGHPVCTVFAEGTDASACYNALVQRASGIYSRIT
ncbi:MAG: ATP-grasp domain-containing protein [Acidobacteria bacterium]|nr:ATP-grasp domain-containing protein [Acidobacteriota bacterium]